MSFQVFYNEFSELIKSIEHKVSENDDPFVNQNFSDEKTQFDELLIDVTDLARSRLEETLAVKLTELQDNQNFGYSRAEGPQLTAQVHRVQRVMKTFGEHLFATVDEPKGRKEIEERFSRPVRSKMEDFTKQVFIVHGHDEALLSQVARLIEKLGLEAIILKEQADQGKTIIEKFEKHADVGFAVVLMTTDDMGAKLVDAENGNYKARARQNVIMELGYFAASLGRSRMCVLKSEGVEEPSDILGLVYTPVDNAKAWEYKLAKELKSADYRIDLNII